MVPTAKTKTNSSSLKRKPYGHKGTTRNLRHDYCPMPGQRFLLDEELIKQTLTKSCDCGKKCMSQLSAAQIALLRSGYYALGSRAAQGEFIKSCARDFRHLSEKDERLQPHLSFPNSPPLEVCQKAFCLVYGMDQGGLSLPTLKKYVKERLGPQLIKSRAPKESPSFDLCAKFYSHLMMLCSRVSTDTYGEPIYHLNFRSQWSKVYEDRFIPWVQKHYPNSEVPSRSAFYAMHENREYNFHNLHMPGKDEFGRCTECGESTEAIWEADGPEARQAAIEARNVHDKMFKIDKAWYEEDNSYCAFNPDKKSCIAVDQTTLKPGIPAFHPPIKQFDRASRLEVNFGGAPSTFPWIKNTERSISSSIFDNSLRTPILFSRSSFFLSGLSLRPLLPPRDLPHSEYT
eukprot:g35142.t1